MPTLAFDDWSTRARAHEARVDAWVQPHLERRRKQEKHPAEDFLFDYYSYRPSALRRWHPGFGYALEAGDEYAGLKGYSGEPAQVTRQHLESQLGLVRIIRTLLVATAGRSPNLSCFGLHEWAMVYRTGPEEVRHVGWPLRLGHQGTDTVVESHRIACSHFDAFRFFTEPAVTLNTLQPGRDDRPAFEQPGCLHGAMDLYKHAFRLSPLVSSDLIADCFELARDVRAVDMRASPYDLSALGYEPIPIETADGKRAYAEHQRDFMEQATPLRQHLIDTCDQLLDAYSTGNSR